MRGTAILTDAIYQILLIAHEHGVPAQTIKGALLAGLAFQIFQVNGSIAFRVAVAVYVRVVIRIVAGYNPEEQH